MFAKGKPIQQPPQQLLPIETQAKEKLTVYVYEFLLHIGAKNSANALLNEVRLEKPVPIGDAPGFLYSWWNVFWDLYCAATPERRESFEPSNEAKMFHEYMPQGQGNPMMNPAQHQRFNSGGQRQIRMPIDFNIFMINQPNGNMNPNQMGQDPNRVQPGMSPISRLTPPGNRMQPGMPMQGNFNGAPNSQPMRGPQNQAPTPGMPNSQPMSPMSMSMQQPQRWNPNNSQVGPPQQTGQPGQGLQPPPPPMNYPPGSSPLSYQNVQMGGHHGGPGTPNLMPSPQDANNDFNNLIKNVPNQFQDQNMGHMVQMNQEMNMNNEMMDSMKHSPMQNIQVNRHPNEEHNQMNDLNYAPFNDPSLFQ